MNRIHNRFQKHVLQLMTLMLITMLVFATMIVVLLVRLPVLTESTITHMYKMDSVKTEVAPKTIVKAKTVKSKPKAKPKAKPKTKPYITKTMTLTFYCACMKCCGKTNGITASGARVKEGVTIAAPSTYHFGTKMWIKGLGYRVVQDRGGSIKGNRIDVYVPNHAQALKLGMYKTTVRIYK